MNDRERGEVNPLHFFLMSHLSREQVFPEQGALGLSLPYEHKYGRIIASLCSISLDFSD